MSELTRSQVLSKAWPIILANIATPLLGLTDTAVIGNTGTAVDLGAIALGAVIFNFVYWTFGFLRMGTTGFVAQASGAGNELEIRLSLGRALILSGGIGLLLLTLQGPIALLMFPLLDASEAVSLEAKQYYFIRIWGAPAALTMYATMGLFIGLGMSRYLMVMQLLLNGLNIALDILLGGVLGWGVAGIAWGTVLSEWTVGLGGLLFALHILKVRQRSEVESADFWPKRRLFDPEKLLATLSTNWDIFLRTLTLLIGFGWFTRQGAQISDAVLAANHILLQIITFAAFFLDGFAFVTESLVGRALGRRSRLELNRAIRLTFEMSGLTALAMTLAVLIPGAWAIEALSDQPKVVELALHFRYWAALYVLLSFAAFQLDGVFIGATKGAVMRNASLLSLLGFLLAWWLLRDFGNTGLWAAFVFYVVIRAVTLGVHLPGLRRSIQHSKS